MRVSSVFRYRLQPPVEPDPPPAPIVEEEEREPVAEADGVRAPRKGLMGRLQLWTSRSAV